MSEETKKKISIANTGKPNAKKGKKLSQETIDKIKKSKKERKDRLGYVNSPETREKMRIAKLGVKQSPEHIANRVLKLIGIPLTEETKKKIGDANRGKKRTIEQKENCKKRYTGWNDGAKSHLWKDGRTSDKEYISWSKNKRNRLKLQVMRELGSHTYGEWELLKKQYNYTCPCCGLSEPFDQKSQYLTEDHIIPLSKGGSDLIENIQPLCLNCNISKNNKIIKFII